MHATTSGLDTKVTLEWFKCNSLQAIGNKSYKQFKLTMDHLLIHKKSVKLLGITIDSKLNFNSHIENICNMASYKVFALQRIRKYISTDHAKTLASFIYK